MFLNNVCLCEAIPSQGVVNESLLNVAYKSRLVVGAWEVTRRRHRPRQPIPLWHGGKRYYIVPPATMLPKVLTAFRLTTRAHFRTAISRSTWVTNILATLECVQSRLRLLKLAMGLMARESEATPLATALSKL